MNAPLIWIGVQTNVQNPIVVMVNIVMVSMQIAILEHAPAITV